MKKAFAFLPGHRSNRPDRDSVDSHGSVFKRREQLRKAQRTHRQRKDQYFKSVESEVLRLRASEVDLLVQVQTLSDHVDLLQKVLDQHGLSELAALDGKLKAVDGGGADLPKVKKPVPGSEQLNNEVTSWGLPVDMNFELTNSSTYPISHNHFDQVISDHLPQAHAEVISTTNTQNPDQLSGPPVVTSQPDFSQSRCAERIRNQDMAGMGMEFVMTLENPCIPHLGLHIDKPNGHALLASATLIPSYHHQHLSSTFSSPFPEFHGSQSLRTIFEKLLALSEQLVVEDELSPTQAWCYILQQPWASKLDPNQLRKLSASILKLVKCYGFGAVMKKDAFDSILLQTLPRIGLD